MNRKQWSIGTVSLILMILCIAGVVIVWNEWKVKPGSIGQREPLPGFGYCSSRESKPCILSIHLKQDGGMVIDLLVNGSLQDFYIKIRQEAGERVYECQKEKPYSTRASCTGQAIPVGERVNFLIISKDGDTPLAEGSFPIIGLALATPEVRLTPTLVIFDHSPR